MTREDVMAYSAMICGFSVLAAGFLRDLKFNGTAFSFVVIAILAAIAGLVAYLHTTATRGDTTGT